MAKKPIEYQEPEIPAEFKLKYAIKNANEKLKDEYTTWRIFALDPSDGSVLFCGNNKNDDWKTERNAKERAQWINDHPTWFGLPKNGVAVVRKCKITIEEI